MHTHQSCLSLKFTKDYPKLGLEGSKCHHHRDAPVQAVCFFRAACGVVLLLHFLCVLLIQILMTPEPATQCIKSCMRMAPFCRHATLKSNWQHAMQTLRYKAICKSCQTRNSLTCRPLLDRCLLGKYRSLSMAFAPRSNQGPRRSPYHAGSLASHTPSSKVKMSLSFDKAPRTPGAMLDDACSVQSSSGSDSRSRLRQPGTAW